MSITREDIDELIDKMWEDERTCARHYSHQEGDYCDLVTGIWVVPGDTHVGLVIESVTPFGRTWPILVHKTIFETFRQHCIANGCEPGETPFQLAARSLPLGMGGTGQLFVGSRREEDL